MYDGLPRINRSFFDEGSEEDEADDDTELFSLLWLLRDRLTYKWGVQCMKPQKNIALLTPDRWHITPQADESGSVPLLAISSKTRSQELKGQNLLDQAPLARGGSCGLDAMD